jgi:glycosyltransferase involved in cell wall biosynthesis
MPRVSVLMPVFNTAQYLSEALESVRDQRFSDFELIVVNDGSTDGCSEILRAFATREPRMRLIERPNRGLIATRNQLLEEARGDLIAWMDSDDASLPDRLERQVGRFDSDPSLVCLGTNIQLVDPEGCPLGLEEFEQEDQAVRAQQARGGGFRFPSTMQRRSVATAVGGFRSPFRIGEDLDYLLRVAEQGKVGNLPDVLYVYRQHLLNTCSVLGVHWPEYCAVILDLANERRDGGSDRLQRGEQVELPQFDGGEARKLAPFVLLDWSRGAQSIGDRRRALRYALASLRQSPFQSVAWRQVAKLLLRR